MKMLFRAAAALLAAAAWAPAIAQYGPFTSAPPPLQTVGGGEVLTVIKNDRPFTVSLSQIAGLGGGAGLTAGTINGLPTASALGGTEGSACVQGGQLVQCNPSLQSAYTLGAGITGLGAAGTLTGSELNNLVQGGTAVKAPLSSIADYAVRIYGGGLGAASALTGTETGVLLQGGTAVKATPAQVATYTLTTAASALPAAATLGGTETLAGVQAGAAAKVTPAQIASYAANLGAYLGPVASRTAFPDLNGSGKQVTGCTVEYATENLSALKLVFANGYVDGFSGGSTWNELTPTGTTTRTASVTFPMATGSPKAFTWNGGATSTTDAQGALPATDLLALGYTIPRGAPFLVCNYQSGTAYSFLMGGKQFKPIPGDTLNFSATDLTMTASGRTANTSGTYAAAPVAVLGMTTRGTVLIQSNSRQRGIGARVSASAWAQGGVELALANSNVGFINASVSGDAASNYNASHAMRVQLAQYVTSVIGFEPVNDYDTRAHSAATTISDLGTFASTFNATICAAGKNCGGVWLITGVPYTSPTSISVSGISVSGTTATATVSSTANLLPGEWVTIAGATPTALNGFVRITSVPSGTTFTYVVPSGTASLSSGTVTLTDVGNPLNVAFRSTEATRQSVNASIRGMTTAGQAGVIDLDAAVDPTGSGYWPNGASYDGLHEDQIGGLLERNAGAVPVNSFTVLKP